MTNDERLQLARQFVEEFELEIPVVLDEVNDEVSTAYAAHPDRLYLVGKDGRIAFAGERGPRGFKPEQLDQAIKVLTGREKPDLVASTRQRAAPAERGRPPADGGYRRGGFGRSDDPARASVPRGAGSLRLHLPVTAALDADQDGEISPDELANAVAALRKLDANDDGKLSGEELSPRFATPDERSGVSGPPGGRGEGGGFRRGAGGFPSGRGGDDPGGRGPGGAGFAQQMVARIMAHDQDKDGKVSIDEAPERMQGFLRRLDQDEDGFVTPSEIEEMAASGRFRPGGFGGPGGDRRGQDRGGVGPRRPEEPDSQ